MIKAVIFDAGGVLCDWETICRKFAEEINVDYKKFMEVYLKHSFDPEFGSDIGQMTADEFFKKITLELGVPEKALDWRKRFVPGFKRIEPTYKLLDELKGKFRLGMLTNSKIGLWDEWESIGHFKDYFEVIMDSSTVHLLKPDPEMFNLLCQRLNLKTEECLFIDDDSKNTGAAEKFGFKTVHFTEPEVSVAAIKNVLGIE
ncbi:MAG: HAD family phosphatase [Candidatus Beckwithbacteria bacterium]|nr:HAD family phosphatase [Candidatus Beckwithbacteria bacterium]